MNGDEQGVLMQSYCMTQLQYRKEFLNTTVEDLQEALKECDVKIVQHREAKVPHVSYVPN